MADKRTIEDLSLEELEQVLAIKRREDRQTRLQRMKQSGRVIETADVLPPKPIPVQDPPPQSDPSGLPAQTIELAQDAISRRRVVPEFEDAIDRHEYKRKDSRAGEIWRTFVDRSLLFVEMGAVIGLLILGFTLVNGVNILRDETAAAQAAADAQRRAGIPTPVPTPQLALARVVLPSGHTPPQDGVSSFNFEEVPVALRNQIAAQVYLPPDAARPPATDDTPLRINIPAIGIDQTIVQGVDWNATAQGEDLQNGANPRNDSDNVVLAAHNDIYGEIFRDLDQLQPGDQFEVQTRSGVYTYIVRETQIVEPDA
ncbi:MAG: sortase, partial [Anaerolineae bacterium]|nr:sortase [Anaerolineae bacterium]